MYRPRKVVFHIKELARKHNLTQTELAMKAAIEPARLSDLANGKRKQVEISYITKIAEELDITDINEIMSLEYVDEEK